MSLMLVVILLSFILQFWAMAYNSIVYENDERSATDQ
jgi:hypothetical protein